MSFSTGPIETSKGDLFVASGRNELEAFSVSSDNNQVPMSDSQANLGIDWKEPEGAIVSVGDSDYTMSSNDKRIHLTQALTVKRTITLPLANTVPRGRRVYFTDENRVLTGIDLNIFWSIKASGADTLKSLHHRSNNEVQMRQPDTFGLESNGVDQWIVIEHGLRRPFHWWQHPNDVALPTATWVPLPWMEINSSNSFGFAQVPTATTNISSGSNGNILPQATINVDSTTGFTNDGYLVITGPPASGKDTVVTYTGKTATTFTGCNSTYRATGVGISSGTLATGQVVKQAQVEFLPPSEQGYLWNYMIEVCINNLATTQYFAVRFRSIDNFFNLVIMREDVPGVNIALQHKLLCGQPGFNDGGVPARIEMFHNGGSGKYSKKDGIQSPLIMACMMSTQ